MEIVGKSQFLACLIRGCCTEVLKGSCCNVESCFAISRSEDAVDLLNMWTFILPPGNWSTRTPSGYAAVLLPFVSVDFRVKDHNTTRSGLA